MPNPDSLQNTALEHLRVIRTLMERAHIYRAVSAPAALIGGVLSLGAAAYCFFQSSPKAGPTLGNLVWVSRDQEFFLLWMAVLVITGSINLWLLSREASNKGQPTITDGLRMALRALIPPLLTGGVLGGCMVWTSGTMTSLGTIVWILCYGLALQATVSFAPRSLIFLARAFLITGQLLVLLYFFDGIFIFKTEDGVRQQASIYMGLTFGLYHVVYAITVFASKPQTSESIADRFIEAP